MHGHTFCGNPIGAAVALWLLEVGAGTIGFLWPNLARGFGGDMFAFATLRDLTLRLPIMPRSWFRFESVL